VRLCICAALHLCGSASVRLCVSYCESRKHQSILRALASPTDASVCGCVCGVCNSSPPVLAATGAASASSISADRADVAVVAAAMISLTLSHPGGAVVATATLVVGLGSPRTFDNARTGSRSSAALTSRGESPLELPFAVPEHLQSSRPEHRRPSRWATNEKARRLLYPSTEASERGHAWAVG